MKWPMGVLGSEGGMEAGRQGCSEGGRKGGRQGGREAGRQGCSEGGREAGREGGREGRRMHLGSCLPRYQHSKSALHDINYCTNDTYTASTVNATWLEETTNKT